VRLDIWNPRSIITEGRMNQITAKGQTDFGYLEITITGDQNVQQINCEDPVIVSFVADGIRNAGGWLANNYHPPENTMLQAYAYLVNLFVQGAVTVHGDIGEIPFEEGVIY